MACQYKDLATAPTTQIDVGGGYGGWVDAGDTWIAAFGDALVELGHALHFGGLVEVKVAAGLRTLEEMRYFEQEHNRLTQHHKRGDRRRKVRTGMRRTHWPPQ